MTMIQAELLLPGTPGSGRGLALTEPISFWGGVDPKSGTIADVRHPERGQAIAGRTLMVPSTVGSCSGAAILLELVHAGRAPAALILHEPDAILLLGLIVAKEMGWDVPIALRLDRTHYDALHDRDISVDSTGLLSF